MQVEVRVFATLRRYTPEMSLHTPLIMDVQEGATLADIRDRLGLPEQEVKVIMRNFRQADPGDLVAEGDRIAFIPAAGGG